jgi:hypothetical protein
MRTTYAVLAAHDHLCYARGCANLGQQLYLATYIYVVNYI